MAEKRQILLRNYYDRDIAIDDVTGEATLPIRVRRFSPDQLLAFKEGWSRCEDPPSQRVIYRKDSEDGVSMDEVRRRRLVEMTVEEREQFERAAADDEKFAQGFCREQIAAHVWVHPDVDLQLQDEGGNLRPVRTGADLVAVFGGNFSMLMTLTAAILLENTLSPEKKRALRLRSASRSSSDAPPPSTGDAPAATAAPVALPASASAADASGPSGPIPSSETV